MPSLRYHLIKKNHSENEISSLIGKLEADKEIDEVQRSKELALGLSEIIIGIRVVNITIDLINKLKELLKPKDYLEFRCGSKKVKIKGTLTIEEVKTLYSSLCPDV